jgi:hypothetical protein
MGALQGSDALLTIAEVHIALAAASGIILALTRDPEHWSAFDAQRIFQLLAASLGGTFRLWGVAYCGCSSSPSCSTVP